MSSYPWFYNTGPMPTWAMVILAIMVGGLCGSAYTSATPISRRGFFVAMIGYLVLITLYATQYGDVNQAANFGFSTAVPELGAFGVAWFIRGSRGDEEY